MTGSDSNKHWTMAKYKKQNKVGGEVVWNQSWNLGIHPSNFYMSINRQFYPKA